MNVNTKSLVRHIITGLGSVLVFFGLTKWLGVYEYLIQNFDAIWDAIFVLVGAITTIIGFKKGRTPDPV